jgi:hypothetical protein
VGARRIRRQPRERLSVPDDRAAQYIYNPAFRFKVLFMAVAGINAFAFYRTVSRRTMGPGAGDDAPRAAKIIAATSLCLWAAVIVCGRLLTFYRPDICGPDGPGAIANCIPQLKNF